MELNTTTPSGNGNSLNPPPTGAERTRILEVLNTMQNNEANIDGARATSEDPFKKSSTMRRSPQRVEVLQDSTIDLTSQSDPLPQSVEVLQEKTSATIDLTSGSDFLTLGKELESLVELLEEGKRRVLHQPIRDAISKAKALYDRIDVQLRGEMLNKVLTNDNSSQTSPLLKTRTDPKRKQQNNEGTPKAKRTPIRDTAAKGNASPKEKGEQKPADLNEVQASS